MNAGPYSVGAIKTFMGMDCPGYNAKLYRNGQAIAFVINDGNGGPTDFRGLTDEEEGLLQTHLQGQTYEFWGKTENHTIETFVGALIDTAVERKKMLRLCKTHTVYRLHSDQQVEGQDQFWQIKLPFAERVLIHLKGKYGADLKEVLDRNGEPVAL